MIQSLIEGLAVMFNASKDSSKPTAVQDAAAIL